MPCPNPVLPGGENMATARPRRRFASPRTPEPQAGTHGPCQLAVHGRDFSADVGNDCLCPAPSALGQRGELLSLCLELFERIGGLVQVGLSVAALEPGHLGDDLP